MKYLILVLLVISLSLTLVISCDDDSSSPNLADEIFIYGTITTDIIYGGEGATTRIWAGVFNHTDFDNLSASYSDGFEDYPLEFSNNNTFLSFTGDTWDDSLTVGEDYTLTVRDAQNSYTGSITVIPYVTLTDSRIESEQLVLEWNDVGADFYEIDVYNSYADEAARQIHTELTNLTINLSEIPGDGPQIDVTVKAFKGYNPVDETRGNINGCHGYYFAYSSFWATVDIETSNFQQQNRSSKDEDFDKIVDSYLNGRKKFASNQNSGIEYIHTYAFVMDNYFSSTTQQLFSCESYYEPVGAVESYEAVLNGIELDSEHRFGFYHDIFQVDNFLTEFTGIDVFELDLIINGESDEASVVMPDSFSITTYLNPMENLVAPLEIAWRDPDNTKFFFIYFGWNTLSSSSWTYNNYLTESNSYVFETLPADIDEYQIGVYAINGANPIYDNNPNLSKHKGYFHAVERCQNKIYGSMSNKNGYGSEKILDEAEIRKMFKQLTQLLQDKNTSLEVSKF